jgi:hypothetical protein
VIKCFYLKTRKITRVNQSVVEIVKKRRHKKPNSYKLIDIKKDIVNFFGIGSKYIVIRVSIISELIEIVNFIFFAFFRY